MVVLRSSIPIRSHRPSWRISDSRCADSSVDELLFLVRFFFWTQFVSSLGCARYMLVCILWIPALVAALCRGQLRGFIADLQSRKDTRYSTVEVPLNRFPPRMSDLNVCNGFSWPVSLNDCGGLSCCALHFRLASLLPLLHLPDSRLHESARMFLSVNGFQKQSIISVQSESSKYQVHRSGYWRANHWQDFVGHRCQRGNPGSVYALWCGVVSLTCLFAGHESNKMPITACRCSDFSRFCPRLVSTASPHLLTAGAGRLFVWAQLLLH